MNHEYLNREPGMYESGGGALALVEQQRADALEQLRSSKAVCVTCHDDKDGGYLHWAFVDEEASAGPFLVYAAARAVVDAASALETDTATVCRILLDYLEREAA